jgi:hypothetical protein
MSLTEGERARARKAIVEEHIRGSTQMTSWRASAFTMTAEQSWASSGSFTSLFAG